MLDKIVSAIRPTKLMAKVEEREKSTAEAIERSRKARRQAEAKMIQSYREAGVAVVRHEWRD